MSKFVDLTGQRFNKLVVLNYIKPEKRKQDWRQGKGAQWWCRCDCGKELLVLGYVLKTGNTKSCGCMMGTTSQNNMEKARLAKDHKIKNEVSFEGEVCKLELNYREGGVAGYALIDKEDYKRVCQHVWYIGGGDYVIAKDKFSDNKYETLYLHRIIMDAADKMIDHINHDTLDNRKANLREVNHNQNFQNAKKQKTYAGKPTSSIYKGVSYDKRNNKWKTAITVYKKKINLGDYDSELEAAEAYDRACRKYFGEYGRPNFKEED